MIADSPTITGRELEQQLAATRKQIGYSVEKINQYLEDRELPRIERLKTGKFRISAVIADEFKSDQSDLGRKVYIYSDKERPYLILLILLSREEDLSLNHFTAELKISKNTLLLDMKKTQDLLDEYQITLSYSRKQGYTLWGSEFAKRGLLVVVVRKILRFPQGEQELHRLCRIDAAGFAEVQSGIIAVELSMQMRIADARMAELPYLVYIYLLRIGRGRQLEELPEAFSHIVGTREYRTVAAFAQSQGVTSRLECMFLTAQIQSSNLQSLAAMKSEAGEWIEDSAMQVIDNFERSCCICFKEKKLLLEALIQHWTPAFYRIRYDFHLENSITELVLPQYEYLHNLVRRAAKPFEAMLGKEIPDDELIYITVLFGSWLRREGFTELIREKRRAVVVCANGVSVSNFLFISLRELLPEIEFDTWMSVRDFEAHLGPYDMVFSTVYVKTGKPLFLVKPFLNDGEKQKFRNRVFRELNGVDLQELQISQFMEIIEEHATVHTKDQLVKKLSQMIGSISRSPVAGPPAYGGEDRGEITLGRLLTEDTVMIAGDRPGWAEAIRLASGPLLASGAIQPEYVDEIIRYIEAEEPYIMVADGVIIAHAGIDAGVNRVAMSLLRLPGRISIKGYMDADIIVILGTPDKTVHLNALYQLNALLDEREVRNRLRTAGTVAELLELINQ